MTSGLYAPRARHHPGVTGGAGFGRTIGVFVAAAVLLLAFVGWERRVKDPLVLFSIFRLQTLTAANIAGFVLGTALDVPDPHAVHAAGAGPEPARDRLGYLAVAGTAIIWANVARRRW